MPLTGFEELSDNAPVVGEKTLLLARGVTVDYRVRSRGGGHKRTVSAVDHVDLEVAERETLGLVGESGCGKTTIGRALIGRVPLSDGTIEYDGRDVTHAGRREWRDLHRDIQLIFQNPYASMNPRMRVRDIIGEPLRVHGLAKGPQLRTAVDELLDMVRLPRAAGDRYPHAFSGGQRQRVVIARALALRPRFIVADEPVSALDVSIQAQIIGLMQDLQRDLGISYLFIAHNLAVVKHIAHRVAVMYLGHVVEVGDKASLYRTPLHPYTQALLSAAPVPDPTVKRPERVILSGDPPSAIAPPSGCRFHTRCPVAISRCSSETPPLVELLPGHKAACWVAQAKMQATSGGTAA
ncbi:MAG TPA: oligopeptide/dipeptide ABC transporter ATP-binding protein [Jatrophihabitantaceae bacterium]|jgi:oligopeptide/dipeptide ABC transporter ATP-binding protein|nr:oligopeptide/dipeptide ABC transporter ATP-binding protein [Jatrophihabitantaceae bacterium]